mmetsp:Transcript_32432/g.39890  ORF Transcript_32432/g.39890 Transcript_32432/m.39890 type:complete len:128 (-) Transcript_32432:1055-1438(-)
MREGHKNVQMERRNILKHRPAVNLSCISPARVQQPPLQCLPAQGQPRGQQVLVGPPEALRSVLSTDSWRAMATDRPQVGQLGCGGNHCEAKAEDGPSRLVVECSSDTMQEPRTKAIFVIRGHMVLQL